MFYANALAESPNWLLQAQLHTAHGCERVTVLFLLILGEKVSVF
jgi:hypothetical protein